MQLSKKSKIVIVSVVCAALILTALGLGGWGISFYFVVGGSDRVGDRTIAFCGDTVLTLGDAVTAPASGVTRRSVRAQIFEDGVLAEDAQIAYRMSKAVKGVTLEGDMLIVSSELERGATFTVYASDASENGSDKLCISKKVQVKKDKKLRDVAANPIEKEGWELYYNDEFDGSELDYTSWSPYYLRNWVQDDARTQANYFFEDGALVLRADEDTQSWSSQNSGVKVSGISSYERNYLHKFGEVGSGAVFNKDVPEFDGIATKYGYFELRLRMPDTKDGSHFAWWMIGTQDDMNAEPLLSGDTAPMQSHYSNQTGEIDIIETTLSDVQAMKQWRPVIHPNGTTDYAYHWLPAYEIPGNPTLEYHVYGFEWDESGVKFYVDGQLASSSDRSPSYRMMTFLTTYATGGLGKDRGIYPKDAYIDYFRIYKRAGEGSRSDPASVVLNNRAGNAPVPDEVFIPDAGENTVRLNAFAVNAFDESVNADVRWRLSASVDGFSPESEPYVSVKGVTLDASGTIVVTPEAAEGTDMFVTAYVSDRVKQTKHIRLSRGSPKDGKLLFDVQIFSVPKGNSARLSARLYDQYGAERAGVWTRYRLTTDLTGKFLASYEGVTLSEDGELAIAADCPLPVGTVLVVTAQAGSKSNRLFIRIGE